MRKPTDGELIAAAHLTTAVMQHGGEAIRKDRALEYTLKYFDEILATVRGMGHKESLAEIINQVNRSDTD